MSLNRAFVAGVTVVSAADLNGLQAGWDPYVPALTGMTLGNGAVRGRSYRQGKTVAVRVVLQGGSSTATTGAYSVSLPYAAHGTDEQLLTMKWFNGTVNYPGFVYIAAGASVALPFTVISATNTGMTQMGSGGQALAGGGVVTFEGVYEAA